MRRIRRGVPVLILMVGAAACDGDPTEPYRPYALTIAEGDGQVGSAGSPMEPFSVLVEDDSGHRLDGADVVWTVPSGAGLFRVLAGGQWRLVESYANQTGYDGPGLASARFFPTELGDHTVTAHASRPNRVSLGSVDFEVHVGAVAIILAEPDDPNGPVDWDAEWPNGPQGLSVEMGTTVEWQTRTANCCDYVVRTISVPDGGTPFEHSYVSGDTAFAVTPDAPGEWQWEWERSDDLLEWGWGLTWSDTATFVVE